MTVQFSPLIKSIVSRFSLCSLSQALVVTTPALARVALTVFISANVAHANSSSSISSASVASTAETKAASAPRSETKNDLNYETVVEAGDAILDDGKIFYREVHALEHSNSGTVSLIRYEHLDHQTFAELRSISHSADAADSSVAARQSTSATIRPAVAERSMNLALLPDTHFEDRRDHYEYKSELDTSRSHLVLSVKESTKDQWKSSTEKVEGETFILQTLPLLLKAHEGEIRQLKRMEIKMAVPSRRSIETIRLTMTQASPATLYKVRLEPASFLLRSLLPASTLTYDLQSHRVTDFEGISNILDDNDKSKHVRIHFELARNPAS